MDPREKLLADICTKPHHLKPVRKGRVVVGRGHFNCDSEESTEEDSPKPVRKVIKPVAAFQVSTDDSDSYVSDTDEEGRHHIQAPLLSPLSPVFPDPDNSQWKQAVARDMVVQPSTGRPVGRRHTISACDAKNGRKHKWQNPIECLSLTLEEVSHIRMVLTKAELEGLVTDPELYSQVAKGKVCFTCKKTKFSILSFEWGTKCKFCQRNVCNYCLRKMNVPTEHFEKIPVYTLSPVPISPEVLEALKVYESTGSVPHSPITERKNDKTPEPEVEKITKATPSADDSRLATKRKSLQRSHTIGVGMESRPPPNKALLKGPQMSICCDCKTMIMEIIRASRSTVAFIPNKDKKEAQEDQPKSANTAPEPSTSRPKSLKFTGKPRPRSMLANFNFKSFHVGTDESEA